MPVRSSRSAKKLIHTSYFLLDSSLSLLGFTTCHRDTISFYVNKSACLIGCLVLTGDFDGRCRGELHEVRPANLLELLLDRREELQGRGQAGVSAVVDLRLEADGPVSSPLPGRRV